MDRLTMFDDCALRGAGHHRAVEMTMELAEQIAGGTRESAMVVYVGEKGGGKTRVLREVFERVCERFDRNGRYIDTLPPHSLNASRDDSPVTMPFWWWPIDFAREETLGQLTNIELAQLRAESGATGGRVGFAKAAAAFIPGVGTGLGVLDLLASARENLKAYTHRSGHDVADNRCRNRRPENRAAPRHVAGDFRHQGSRAGGWRSGRSCGAGRGSLRGGDRGLGRPSSPCNLFRTDSVEHRGLESVVAGAEHEPVALDEQRTATPAFSPPTSPTGRQPSP